MKHYKTWINTARIAPTLTLLGALACASSARAQAVTGDTYLDNILPSATYGSWAGASISSTPTGLNVLGLASYGSAYFGVPNGQLQTLNAADTQVTLVMTVNGAATSPGNANSGYWLGIPFIINDNAGPITYGGYAGEFGYTGAGTATWSGNTVTETVPLDPTQLAAVALGNDTIYGFNLQLDPAVFPSGFENITFNSLTLSAPAVPEPSTFALIGTGTAFLWSMRRRIK